MFNSHLESFHQYYLLLLNSQDDISSEFQAKCFVLNKGLHSVYLYYWFQINLYGLDSGECGCENIILLRVTILNQDGL